MTDQGYWFKVTVTSPRPLPTFEVTHKIPPYVARRAITRTVGGGRKAPRLYVIPKHDRPIADEWTERLAQQVARGRQFVSHRRAGVQLTAGGILYTYFRMMSLPVRSGAMEPLVDWLIGVAALLEEIAPPAEEAAPGTTDGGAARLPYGQISDVDPTGRAR